MAVGKKTGGRNFQPGQSGNPGGKHASTSEWREWCREWMKAKGLHRLASIAESSDDPNAFRAVELIAAYAYGKPTQAVEHSGPDGGAISLAVAGLPEDALRKLVAEARG